MTDIEYIRQALSPADVWGQLAEEAAELAQAALKMQRLELGVNPPRKSPEECIDGVLEELADVNNCIRVLDIGRCKLSRAYIDMAEGKMHRWAEGLKEVNR